MKEVQTSVDTNAAPTPLERSAVIVSTLGHPLLTTSAFLLFLGHHNSSTSITVLQSAIVIGVVVVPLALWNLFHTRAGTYSDFDVSTRTQRHSMYRVGIGLLSVATAAAFYFNVSRSLHMGMLCILAMFLIASAVNHWIKISLHAAVSFFLSFAGMAVDHWFGGIWLGLSVLVAISRYILRRHTVAEILWGAALGTMAGLTLIGFISVRH